MRHRLSLILTSLVVGGLGMALTGARPKPDGEAPYVGEYTLDQGGTDAAGGVHLLILPGGDYAIVYFGGIQHGTWKVAANGELQLKEWTGDPTDFVVYGRQTPTLGSDVRLQFEEFQESYAKIGLAGTSGGLTPLHPAFNDDANCYAESYSIRRPAAQLVTLQLAAYQEPARARYAQVPFTKKLLYTFPLNKRYNDYQVLYRAQASKPAADYVGRVVNNELTLYAAATGHLRGLPGAAYGERSELSATDIGDIKPLLKEVRQPVPGKLTVLQKSDNVELTYTKITGTSQPLQESAVKLLAPLFTARCE